MEKWAVIMNIKYSFIIPTHNEELFLSKTLKSIEKFEDKEIIVVDGGSNDKTIDIALKYDAKIINSVIGRGVQLNQGVFNSKGNILCFLHADTLLPDNAHELIELFFSDPNNNICRFKLGFDIDHWLLNRYKFFSKYDSIFTRFGDMFIAVRKEFFFEVGGYPNWKTFEDVDFLKRASDKSKIKVLDGEVISSSRTFIKYGFIKQQFYNGYLLTKYLIGFRSFIEENNYYKRTPKNNNAVIVFLKYPKEGNVKTRLAKTIGNYKATQIYSTIVKSLIKSLKKMNDSYTYLFYSNSSEQELVKKWIKGRFIYCEQIGADLGARMSNAFKLVLGQGNNKTLIVGTDIPELSNQIINNAFEKLDDFDIVIGPSPDGGFYLLGMKNYYSSLFEGITYSTDTVFTDTIERIENENLSYFLLDSLQDIDTEVELLSWLRNSRNKKLANKISLLYN